MNINKPIVIIGVQLFPLETDIWFEISLLLVSSFKKIYSYIQKYDTQ
jgi:hypothetical protein